jgi:hypothetical protein
MIRIISGGQTGADRAALQFALDNGISYGGWVLKGRRAEDGRVPVCFTELTEVPSADYRVRTEMNVGNSCATVVFTMCPLEMVMGGSLLTIALAKKHKKPWLHIDLSRSKVGYARSLLGVESDAVEFDTFVKEHADAWVKVYEDAHSKPGDGCLGRFTLNIAGSRESKSPGIFNAVMTLLKNSKFLFTNRGQVA